MIGEALTFLKNRLNAHLNSGLNPEESHEDQVVFIDGPDLDPITFKLGAVTEFLINIEEENTLRSPDLYSRTSADGVRYKVHPEIRLHLHILFVAHYKQYEKSLHYLSRIIRYFQAHRKLAHDNAPELSDNIQHLIMELLTLPFSEQDAVWNALRTTYHPSVLYKCKLLLFHDDEVTELPNIQDKTLRISP